MFASLTLACLYPTYLLCQQFCYMDALVPSTEPKVRLSEGKAKFWSSESKDMLAWFLLSRDKIQPKVKKLLAFPSNELGNTKNEASNNVFPKPPALMFTTTPPPPYPVGAGLVPARVPTHPPSPSRHREGAQPHLLGARSLRYRSLKAVWPAFTLHTCYVNNFVIWMR